LVEPGTDGLCSSIYIARGAAGAELLPNPSSADELGVGETK